MESTEPKLFQVRDINWADTTLKRSGIIPINFDGNNKWIGLTITSYAASIGTIGGSYEDKDHDLLDTAIREYNEELGGNFPIITIDDVINCYAIKSNYMIIILLPLVHLPTYSFIPNDEVHNILWITSTQMRSIYDHRNNRSNYGRSFDLYPISPHLLEIMPLVGRSVNNGIAFNQLVNPNQFNRPERLKQIIFEKTNRIIGDIRKLEVDSQYPALFAGNVCMAFNGEKIGVIRQDYNVYIGDYTELENVMAILKTVNTKIIVSTVAEKNYLSSYTNRVTDLESIILKSAEKFPAFSSLFEFTTVLNIIHQHYGSDQLLGELDLLTEYEAKWYDKTKTFKDNRFNIDRACYLDNIIKINRLIANRGMIGYELKRQIGNCNNIPFDYIIKLALDSHLFIKSPSSSLITLIPSH